MHRAGEADAGPQDFVCRRAWLVSTKSPRPEVRTRALGRHIGRGPRLPWLGLALRLGRAAAVVAAAIVVQAV